MVLSTRADWPRVSKPAPGAPRAMRASIESLGGAALGAFARASKSAERRANTSSTRGSKLVPDSANTFSSATGSGNARRYCRSEANASRQSATASILAPNGI